MFLKNLYKIALSFLLITSATAANADSLTTFTVDIDKPRISGTWSVNKQKLLNDEFANLTTGDYIRPYYAVEVTVGQDGPYVIGATDAPLDIIGILYSANQFNPAIAPKDGFIASNDDGNPTFGKFGLNALSPNITLMLSPPNGKPIDFVGCDAIVSTCPILGGYNQVNSEYVQDTLTLEAGKKYILMISTYKGAGPNIPFDPFNIPPDINTLLQNFNLRDHELFCYGYGDASCSFRYFVYSSPVDTLASMQPNASAMKNAFNSQYATLAYGLNHDCTIYDSNGVCVSVFGRNTSLNDSAFDNNAAGLVLGYKPHAQFRIGTYIDQSLDSNTTGGVKVERSNPDVGVFGVWNMNADGSGLEIRAAANYGKRDLNVTRTVVGTAEAGSGKSDLNAYGALLEASYAYAMNDSWIAKPYAGVRYLAIKRDGYSEASTDNVYNPLTYSNLEQETTSAIAGVRFNGRLAPKVMASLNAGLEHDLHYSIDDYSATGVNGLGTIDMNSQKDRTRPTAGLGISYDVADKQRVAANVQYRKEVFMSESSTTGQVTYTIGF